MVLSWRRDSGPFSGTGRGALLSLSRATPRDPDHVYGGLRSFMASTTGPGPRKVLRPCLGNMYAHGAGWESLPGSAFLPVRLRSGQAKAATPSRTPEAGTGRGARLETCVVPVAERARIATRVRSSADNRRHACPTRRVRGASAVSGAFRDRDYGAGNVLSCLPPLPALRAFPAVHGSLFTGVSTRITCVIPSRAVNTRRSAQWSSNVNTSGGVLTSGPPGTDSE